MPRSRPLALSLAHAHARARLFAHTFAAERLRVYNDGTAAGGNGRDIPSSRLLFDTRISAAGAFPARAATQPAFRHAVLAGALAGKLARVQTAVLASDAAEAPGQSDDVSVASLSPGELAAIEDAMPVDD